MSSTACMFQVLRSLLNAAAPLNMYAMFLTLDTSHVPRLALNAVAS